MKCSLEKMTCVCCGRVRALRIAVSRFLCKYYCPECFDEAEQVFPCDCECWKIWCKRCRTELFFEWCEAHTLFDEPIAQPCMEEAGESAKEATPS